MGHALEAADAPRAPEDPADELRRQAVLLDHEAAQLVERAKEVRAEAAKLRARADRMDDPSKGARIVRRSRDAARSDGLLAAAAVAVEDLPRGFTATDLAVALEIADKARATRLLLALSEMGKIMRADDDGWCVLDPDEVRVRDYITSAGAFTFADAMEALGDFGELYLSTYLSDFKRRGLLVGDGGSYEYVEPGVDRSPRPRRRPPEQDPPAYTEAPRRGEPVYAPNHGERGKKMAGAGKHRQKLRDQRREAMNEARRERAESQSRKAREQNSKDRRRRK